ncbi:hypothetical protein [Sulfitobacter sp. W074]|uniref:hypothetical protein n=1 Tax=Sulfitobacter sp. W074 TaxID=2867026 RepID=UPI0021A7EF89|nr:hypothetical protein [Sulfitobacter sp. W074]UWR39478.1 hypothetical protein K3762_18135 [Sulfitobacter sp. W074]UWR39618.1 hypothetical protein K3762_19525 [Sulfitobacter sp. W074]
MIKILGLVLVSALLATGARAEWMLRRPSAGDDHGSAFAVNAQGHRLDIGCGNGGFIDISLTPDTRPADLKFVGEGAVLYFQVDGGPGLQMPATCGAQGCTQDFMLGGEPWPVSQMQAITSALRSGSRVDVLLGGKVMSRFDLSGSSAALRGLKSRTRCEGL